MAHIFGSIWDRFNRNALNDLSKSVEQQGKSIQDLVAKGQLTPAQYSQLLREVNGLIAKGGVTLDDLAPEVLTKLNEADPEFNLLSIPRDGSVTKKKATFIQRVSNNLFDKSRYTPNVSLDQGNEVPNNSSNASSFIPVEKNTDYTVSGYLGTVSRVSLYDGNKNHILSLRNHAVNEPNSFTFDSREAAYIRLAYSKSISDDLMFNEGSNSMPYEEYKPDVLNGITVDLDFKNELRKEKLTADMMDFIKPPINLLNLKNMSMYKSMDYYGNEIDSPTNHLTDFIKINGGIEYTLHNDSSAARVSFFDTDKKFISQNYETGVTVYTFTTPENAEYLRVNINSTYQDPMMNIGSELLPYQPSSDGVLSKEIQIEKEGKDYPFTFDMSLDGVFDNPLVEEYEDYKWFEGSTSAQVYGMFDDLLGNHPELLTKQSLTNEYTGKEISAYHYKPILASSDVNISLPKVFITGGTHGHEKGSVLTIFLTLKGILEDWDKSKQWEILAHNVEFIIIPVVNPYGYDYHNNPNVENWNTRWNSRGVDINRQFPPNWFKRSVGDAAYGGEAPLTEIEALNVKKIFDENPDIDIFYDYHNFYNSGDNIMIWWPTSGGEFCQRQGNALIRLMGRKWKKDFDYVPSDAILGHTDHMAGGQLHDYANSIGIEINGTFETCDSWLWHPTERGVKHNKEAIKTATEAFTNLLIINLRELDKR